MDRPIASITFVCHGNIMRSAFAAAAMRREASLRGFDLTVDSCGTNARPGKAAHPLARESASALGLSLETHRACLVSRVALHDADLIVAMDYMNAARLLAHFPECRERLVLLGAFGVGPHLEIEDPYGTDAEETRACFARIDTCVISLANLLGENRERSRP